MAVFLTSPLVDVISGGGGVWTTYATGLPGTATGVMLHVRNKDATTDKDWGIRVTGSTDTQTAHFVAASSDFYFIGLNGSQQFDYYTEDGTTSFEAYLIGYFEGEATWFTDAKAYAYSSASTGWKTHDVSANVPVGSVAAICYCIYSGSNKFAVRKTGSVWNPASTNWWLSNISGYIAPLNSATSQFDQYHKAESSKTIYVVGYLTDGSFPDTPTDVSLADINSWESIDLSTDPNLPATGKTGVLVHVGSKTIWYGGLTGGVRGTSITEDLNQGHGQAHYCAPLTDGAPTISGRINNTGIDFFVMGYLGTFAAPEIDLSVASFSPAPPATGTRLRGGKWFSGGVLKWFYTNNPSDDTFDIENTGDTGSTLNYTITDDSGGWLSCSPSSGSVDEGDPADTITVSYDTSILSAGTYSATITVSDTNAGNNPQTISVSILVV